MNFSSTAKDSRFKQRLNRKELVIGTWVNVVRDPIMAKLIGFAGFDYMLIDAEHSGISTETISNTCMLARECGVYPMVRPNNPDDLKQNGRLLDMGAMGLVIPHINNARQAQDIVNSMYYLNGGTRGCNTRSIASGFAKVKEEDMRHADETITCVIQFESVEAIEQADEILSVEGIQVAIVGRGDLAHDMGISGESGDDRVTHMVDRVCAAAKRHNKVFGLLVNDIVEGKRWIDNGIGFLTLGSEVTLLLNAYQNGLTEFRSHIKI